MRDKIFGAFIGVGLTWTGYILYSSVYMFDGRRKLKLQEMLHDDGLPDHEIDRIVNSSLPGRKMYVKDNGVIHAKQSMARAEKEYLQQNKQ